MAKPGKKPEIDEKRARELLERERQRLESAIADAGRVRSGEVRAIAEDIALSDAGGHIEEEAVDDALARSLRLELEALERAEHRLEDGSYGLSVDSGEPIPRKRLEAVPWAERTAEEQKEYERVHGKPW